VPDPWKGGDGDDEQTDRPKRGKEGEDEGITVRPAVD